MRRAAPYLQARWQILKGLKKYSPICKSGAIRAGAAARCRRRFGCTQIATNGCLCILKWKQHYSTHIYVRTVISWHHESNNCGPMRIPSSLPGEYSENCPARSAMDYLSPLMDCYDMGLLCSSEMQNCLFILVVGVVKLSFQHLPLMHKRLVVPTLPVVAPCLV